MPRAEPLRVVVTNDDGIESAGLHLLAAAAVRTGCKVLVAAPEHRAPDHRAPDHRAPDHRAHDRWAPEHRAPGSSAAMTVAREDGRIVMERRKLAGLDTVPGYAVQAAPALIAFTAVREAFGRQPDFLLAGINLGPSTGQAILHSGTVGAAMTAASHGVRAAAFSLDAGEGAAHLYWETAAAVAAQVILALPDLPRGQILNVNVPNVPQHLLRGIRRGQLAVFGATAIDIIDAGEEHLQVTTSGLGAGTAPGTDAWLLAAGYASVTPLLPVSEVPAPWLPWPAVTGAGVLAHP